MMDKAFHFAYYFLSFFPSENLRNLQNQISAMQKPLNKNGTVEHPTKKTTL